MREPHHVALTFRCLSRGCNGSATVGHLRIYQDGELIADDAKFASCLGQPLVPDAFNDEDWKLRPTPWQMGEEYDAGPLDRHLPGVAVVPVPSNFMLGTFDELVVWNVNLSDADVVVSAQGGLPRTEQINVRYTFDLDDAIECKDRSLWDNMSTCFGVNEVAGK